MIKIIQILSTVLGSSKFLDLFKGKERQKNEFLMELASKLHDANFRQTEINKIEAQHKNIFVSGWRPSVGWGISIAIFYNYVIRSLINYIILIFDNEFPLPPKLELSELIPILLALLGMSGYRTFEKIKNKA